MEQVPIPKSFGLDQLSARMESRPILRSFILLRKEWFGGFLFNHYLPPEVQLDRVKFEIAQLCDGSHTLNDIRVYLSQRLDHSPEYLDILLCQTFDLLESRFAVYWRDEETATACTAILDPLDDDVPGSHHLSAPTFVIWEITGACNLRCRHCLSGSGKKVAGEVSTGTAKRIIDMCADMGVLTLNFSGGEPLLRTDIMEISSYASSKRMALELLTNGTMITEEVITGLNGTNVSSVQVSLDGLAPSHDLFRGRPGAFDQAMAGISALKEGGFTIAISAVIHRKNIREIPPLIDLAIDVGADLFKTTLFMPAGRGKQNELDLMLSPDDVKRFAELIREKEESVGDAIRVSTEQIYPWLMKEESRSNEGSSPPVYGLNLGCTAGNSSFYITPDGKAAPCPFLRNFIAGDLTKESARDIWRHSPTFDIFRTITSQKLEGKCADCIHLGKECYGGCRAAAYTYTGNLYAADPLCWYGV
jgi:radical SAM protein with 4Fe4S-binding SPASM domain